MAVRKPAFWRTSTRELEESVGVEAAGVGTLEGLGELGMDGDARSGRGDDEGCAEQGDCQEAGRDGREPWRGDHRRGHGQGGGQQDGGGRSDLGKERYGQGGAGGRASEAGAVGGARAGRAVAQGANHGDAGAGEGDGGHDEE